MRRCKIGIARFVYCLTAQTHDGLQDWLQGTALRMMRMNAPKVRLAMENDFDKPASHDDDSFRIDGGERTNGGCGCGGG